MVYVMDDITARYLLSAILQAMATIWGLVMIFYVYMIQSKNQDMKDIVDYHRKKILNDREFLAAGRLLKDGVRFGKVTMIFFNVAVLLSILSSSLALFFFRTDYLITLSVFLFLIAVIFLGIYLIIIIYAISNYYMEALSVPQETLPDSVKKR